MTKDDEFPTGVVTRGEILETLNTEIDGYNQDHVNDQREMLTLEQITDEVAKAFAKHLGNAESHRCYDGFSEDTFFDEECEGRYTVLREFFKIDVDTPGDSDFEESHHTPDET